VRDQPLTLGREAGNDVVLKSSFVSKAHAVVRYEAGQFLIEDLKSSNGTRVNGAPISIWQLTPGDRLELGDQHLIFFDRAARNGVAHSEPGAGGGRAGEAPAGPNPAAKLVRLGGVALVFGLGLFLGLRFLLIGGAPRTFDDGSGPLTAAAWPVQNGTAPLATDSPLIQQVLAQAKTAGVNPADALYDEGVSQATSGRLLEAARLFAAVVQRDSTRTVARIRLNETRDQLERQIASHHAEAERMVSQLRFEDATFEWERVLLLLEPNDPRAAVAKAAIDAARARLRRR
jgi:pSer/pThr/pTyr-binding forkhead associated (FHA) protein